MKRDATRRPADKFRHVLIIDDHPLYADALATALTHAFKPRRIETATTLMGGLKRLGPDFKPDLAILDLKLPDAAGISGFLRLRRILPEVPIVVISALVSADIVEALIEAGAAGAIDKSASANELQMALRDVRAGRTCLPADLRIGGFPSPRAAALRETSWKIAELTPQQTRILKLICAGMPNKQIAYELSLAEATVKAHVTALLRRLGAQNRTQAAMLVESVNLVEPPQQDEEAEVRLRLCQ